MEKKTQAYNGTQKSCSESNFYPSKKQKGLKNRWPGGKKKQKKNPITSKKCLGQNLVLAPKRPWYKRIPRANTPISRRNIKAIMKPRRQVEKKGNPSGLRTKKGSSYDLGVGH